MNAGWCFFFSIWACCGPVRQTLLHPIVFFRFFFFSETKPKEVFFLAGRGGGVIVERGLLFHAIQSGIVSTQKKCCAFFLSQDWGRGTYRLIFFITQISPVVLVVSAITRGFIYLNCRSSLHLFCIYTVTERHNLHASF